MPLLGCCPSQGCAVPLCGGQEAGSTGWPWCDIVRTFWTLIPLNGCYQQSLPCHSAHHQCLILHALQGTALPVPFQAAEKGFFLVSMAWEDTARLQASCGLLSQASFLWVPNPLMLPEGHSLPGYPQQPARAVPWCTPVSP